MHHVLRLLVLTCIYPLVCRQGANTTGLWQWMDLSPEYRMLSQLAKHHRPHEALQKLVMTYLNAAPALHLSDTVVTCIAACASVYPF